MTEIKFACPSAAISPRFPSRKVFGLAERLGVEATPTVIMVKRGGGDAKELSRGLVTITELEELGQQAWIYFKDRGMK